MNKKEKNFNKYNRLTFWNDIFMMQLSHFCFLNPVLHEICILPVNYACKNDLNSKIKTMYLLTEKAKG